MAGSCCDFGGDLWKGDGLPRRYAPRNDSASRCSGGQSRPPVPCHSEPVRTLAWESVSQRGAAALTERQDAVPDTRFNIPSRRAGPACPAEKCVPGGGTHGSRPTGAYPPKKTTRHPGWGAGTPSPTLPPPAHLPDARIPPDPAPRPARWAKGRRR